MKKINITERSISIFYQEILPNDSSHGSIEELGLLQKIIDKIFFCMKRNSRIGLFLSIEVTIHVIGLVSMVSTIMLLIKIGFPLQGAILTLLSVRIGIIRKNKYF